MNNPLITIITVVRNGAATLEQTMLSVLNQTYPHIEYIIVDGASTDGTVEIIKNYEYRIMNGEFANVSFRWISEPDTGIYNAMNKGINMATGEWINFMNSGDWFVDEYVLCEIYISGYFSNNNTIIYGNRLLYDGNTYAQNESKLHRMRYTMSIFHQSTFIPSILHKNFLFDETYRIAGDYDFFYKMISLKVEFVKTDKNICVFSDNGIGSNVRIQYKECVRVICTNNKNSCFKLLYLSLYLLHFIWYNFKMKIITLRSWRLHH